MKTAKMHFVRTRVGSIGVFVTLIFPLSGTALPCSAQQPFLVKDIKTAQTPAQSDSIMFGESVEGPANLFYFTSDGPLGVELWKGKSTSVEFVRDIRPG